jgi:hypothetical protein
MQRFLGPVLRARAGEAVPYERAGAPRLAGS